jgi:hypothetical protein
MASLRGHVIRAESRRVEKKESNAQESQKPFRFSAREHSVPDAAVHVRFQISRSNYINTIGPDRQLLTVYFDAKIRVLFGCKPPGGVQA